MSKSLPQTPHESDSERMVIGCFLLLTLKEFREACACFSVDDFFLPSSQAIVRVLLALAESNVPFDLLVISEALEKANKLDLVGGKAGLAEYTDGAVRLSAESLTNHIQRIQQAARRRQIQRLSDRAAQLAQSNSHTAQEELQEVLGQLAELRTQASPSEHRDWPAPQGLPDALLPVPSLPAALLPTALRQWLADIADRLQVPLEFPSVPALVLLASLIGNQLRIRPKKHDDWSVTPNLWGAIIGRPGVMKSPAIAEPMKALHRLVKEAEKSHQLAMREWEFEREAAELRKAAVRDRMKKAAKYSVS